VSIRTIASHLFRRRPEASWGAYVPVTFVVALFTLMGLHDGPVPHFFALLALCLFQFWYRSLAGWFVLFAACIAYGVAVAASVDQLHGQYGEYIFFMACGFVPAAVLLMGYPRIRIEPPVMSATASQQQVVD
jgi:hypothetical protein